MERAVEIGILYDLYGSLLTERQREVIEQYYLDDLSLSEIGNNLSISRQAVSMQLHRASTKLEEVEESLQFLAKIRKENQILQAQIDRLRPYGSPLQEVVDALDGLIDRRVSS